MFSNGQRQVLAVPMHSPRDNVPGWKTQLIRSLCPIPRKCAKDFSDGLMDASVRAELSLSVLVLSPDPLNSNWTFRVSSDPEDVWAKACVFYSFSNECAHDHLGLPICPRAGRCILALTSMTGCDETGVRVCKAAHPGLWRFPQA